MYVGKGGRRMCVYRLRHLGHVCIIGHGGHKSMFVFFSCSLPYVLSQGLSSNLEIAHLARLME